VTERTALRREDAAFLESFVPDARAILEELLEKYAEHGIGQLDDLRILEVPPLTEFGTPVEIAGRFGSGLLVSRPGLPRQARKLAARRPRDLPPSRVAHRASGRPGAMVALEPRPCGCFPRDGTVGA
jgi:hypothetical protein